MDNSNRNGLWVWLMLCG